MQRGGAGFQPARGIQPRPLVPTERAFEHGPQAEELPTTHDEEPIVGKSIEEER